MPENTKPYSSEILYDEKPQRTFRGQNLLQIAMPIGGIGAGNVCLNGIGGLQDISIHHTPTTSAMPDGHGLTDAAFGLIHFPKIKNTRLLEGPYPKEWIYNQGLKAQGLRNGGYEGFPRFRNCEFTGEFPFGKAMLSDETLPVQVTITGFNPFIPGDVKNSAIPCAIMEYTFENVSDSECTFEFSYHLSHFAPGADKVSMTNSRNELIPEQGINFYNLEPENSSEFGSATLTLIGYQPVIKGRWFRGGWFDALSVLWHEISDGRFTPNDGSPNGMTSGRNGGSVMLPITLGSHEKITVPVLITWHFPNVGFSYGQADVCESDNVSVCDCSLTSARWHPYYAGQWKNAKEVASYVRNHYSNLRKRTQSFHDALFSSTLPSGQWQYVGLGRMFL